VIVVDASALIAHLDERDALHERAEAALLAAADQPLGCSPITLAEVLVGPARRGRIDEARVALDAMSLDVLALAADAPPRLAVLRADTGLRLPDCCVLLAAQDANASSILTFDDVLVREASRLGF
jgi:predicted nucleic acid-binding protein